MTHLTPNLPAGASRAETRLDIFISCSKSPVVDVVFPHVLLVHWSIIVAVNQSVHSQQLRLMLT